MPHCSSRRRSRRCSGAALSRRTTSACLCSIRAGLLRWRPTHGRWSTNGAPAARAGGHGAAMRTTPTIPRFLRVGPRPTLPGCARFAAAIWRLCRTRWSRSGAISAKARARPSSPASSSSRPSRSECSRRCARPAGTCSGSRACPILTPKHRASSPRRPATRLPRRSTGRAAMRSLDPRPGSASSWRISRRVVTRSLRSPRICFARVQSCLVPRPSRPSRSRSALHSPRCRSSALRST